ncbi:MAG: hypothetical protein FOGNACKC_00842 [Anaerolineae bacterium]|nr:hypothetical protein [Anaerolineae bacterium]
MIERICAVASWHRFLRWLGKKEPMAVIGKAGRLDDHPITSFLEDETGHVFSLEYGSNEPESLATGVVFRHRLVWAATYLTQRMASAALDPYMHLLGMWALGLPADPDGDGEILARQLQTKLLSWTAADLIGRGYVDPLDSGNLLMEVKAVDATDESVVWVKPVTVERTWWRKAALARVMVELTETVMAEYPGVEPAIDIEVWVEHYLRLSPHIDSIEGEVLAAAERLFRQRLYELAAMVVSGDMNRALDTSALGETYPGRMTRAMLKAAGVSPLPRNKAELRGVYLKLFGMKAG